MAKPERVTFLKNGEPYASYEEAITALNRYAEANVLLDGEPVLGRYYTKDGNIETVLAVCTVIHSTESGCADTEKLTFFVSDYDLKNKLSKVAFSGEYDDLSGKPSINGFELVGDATFSELGFKEVAWTGDYNDLTNKPDIPEKAVLYSPQDLTEEEKAQARANIGAGESGFSGDYNELFNKPTIDTTQTASLPTNENETLSGNVKLHKISKTGDYNDLVNKPFVGEGTVVVNYNSNEIVRFNENTQNNSLISNINLSGGDGVSIVDIVNGNTVNSVISIVSATVNTTGGLKVCDIVNSTTPQSGNNVYSLPLAMCNEDGRAYAARQRDITINELSQSLIDYIDNTQAKIEESDEIEPIFNSDGTVRLDIKTNSVSFKKLKNPADELNFEVFIGAVNQ